MLHGAEVVVRFELNTKQTNTLWAECQFLSVKNCWYTQLVDLRG
jgi:hypothetical protein